MTTEIGSKPNKCKWYETAIIPSVRSAGDRAIAKQLNRALWMNYMANHDIDKLQEVADMFLAIHPKRQKAIEATCRHFSIVSEIYYNFESEEYQLAMETIIEENYEEIEFERPNLTQDELYR